MFLSGQPGIFPSGRISNSDTTCESMVSSCLYFIHATPFLRKPSPINKLCGVTGLVVSYPTGFAKRVLWCSHNSCIKVWRVFTCMHHWIWIDSHLGERVPHSTSPGFLFATVGHGPAGRRKTLKQAVFCWNEWLNWEWTVAIWLLKERGGGRHSFHRCRVESALISISVLDVWATPAPLCVVAAFFLGFVRV